MDKKETHLIGHLEEVRQRLIKIVIAFLVFFIGACWFVQDIYDWLIKDLHGRLAVLGPSEILWVYMMIAGICALTAAIPVAAFQLWRFTAPALTPFERRAALLYIPGLSVLFIIGISFGYFVLFPIVLGFLTQLSAGHFDMVFTADKYFTFMLNLTLPFGFLFEMPLAVMFLTRLGIVNPTRLAKARKLSYFLLIVVSVLITPPDFMSDFLVMIPLLVLYEISVTLSRIVYRKKWAEAPSAA